MENEKINSAKIALFEDKQIRKEMFQGEWWFSVIDLVGALTDSAQPSKYWTAMKARVQSEGEFQLSTICRQLKLESTDGKKYETDCSNTEGLFRIIQSIPSPKAEPLKLWLAKAGYERIQEIEDPELATKRTRELYKLKGYSDAWIEKRMRGISIREELTDEWKNRGAKDHNDYQILTSEISKATFGLTPTEYKKVKGLKRENLRDHMSDLELIFNMLGERATTEIHRSEDSKGIEKLKIDAKAGGDIAGGAREKLEAKLGRSVVTRQNFLQDPEGKKFLE